MIPFSASVLRKLETSLAWPRNLSDHVQLAVCIADVGVSASVCEFINHVSCFRDSMMSFLMAFGFMCLQNSGVPTLSIIGTLCGVILILTVWCIWTSWRKQEPSNADKPKRTTLTFEEDHAKQKSKGFEFTRDDCHDSDTKPKTIKRLALRSVTKWSSWTTTLKLPLEKFRRGTSKIAVEESIDFDVVKNEQLDNIPSVLFTQAITSESIDEKEKSCS